MKHIIIINGSGGCGKSTFVSYCKEAIKEKGIACCSSLPCEVIELSSVDFVKEVATYCGWNGRKEEKDRTFLYDMKTALAKWDDVPNKKVIEAIDAIDDKNINWFIFVNIREIDAIESFIRICKERNLSYQTLLIENHNKPIITSNEADANVKNFKYDNIIFNDFDLQILKLLAFNYMKNTILELNIGN